MGEGRVLVLDTSALIAGYEPIRGRGEHYTVPEVLEELRDSMARLRLQTALETGKLKISKPDERFREEAMRVAEETGDLTALSPADLSLLALALQLRETKGEVTLLTEDYSVQNVAHRLGIEYVSLATMGISRGILWVTYCPGCRRTYEEPVPGGVCPICGTRLRRKPLKKSRVEK
ncbi:ribonuclease VapC [Candidatus Bathyarchaeota archaeon]|nr:MAG: ribonuclease VapC [Candidatus Bathyarchaeota archaeon]